MTKIIEKIKTKRSIHYIFIIIIGILVSIPLLWVQIKNGDDGSIHILRVIGLDSTLEKGAFPFLVYPYFCLDWGYVMTVFYSLIVAYVPYVLGLFSGSAIIGLKLFTVLTTILSGIFMYNFVNEVTKKKAVALFAGIFYMVFPYRLENIYARFAIGEFTAFVFIPIVFQGLYNLVNGDKKRHYYIAIGATGLILSHTISTEYTALFCLIYIIYNYKAFFKKDVIKKCAINILFIILMTALYTIPMLEFEMSADYTIFEPRALRTSPEDAAKQSIDFWQFFKDKQVENPVSFILGLPFLTTLLLGVFAYRKMDKKYKDFYITSIILGCISLIMCTKIFPWEIMPNIMGTIQYPWRLLGFAFFFLIPVCSLNIYYTIQYIKRKNIQYIVYAICIFILLVFTAKELSVYKTEDLNLDKNYEQGVRSNLQIHYFSVNRDYMPYKALIQQRKYLLNRGDNTYILKGNIDILNETKDALHLEINFENAEKDSELEIPYLFYPGYTIKLVYNNEEEKVEYSESEYGFMKVTIPENITEGKIIIDYTGTTIEKVAYLISGLSVILFIIYIILYRRKFRKKDEEVLNINEK